MNDFNFNPPTGLRDMTVYPEEPATEAAAREQFQGLLDQIKTYINDNIKTPFNSQSLSISGYQKLPNGLIIQWCKTQVAVNTNTLTYMTATFPVTFPNALLGIADSTELSDANATIYTDTISNKAVNGVTYAVKVDRYIDGFGKNVIAIGW